MPLKSSKIDLRKFNIPPISNSVKRFDTTVSFRIEKHLIAELGMLLLRRYGSKNVPMNSISFVLRSAVKRKINMLKQEII